MERVTNYVGDIEGACPARRHRYNKPDSHSTADIDGASPKKAPPPRQANSLSGLNTLDLDGAQPRQKVFRTQRVVNPLEPVYRLPKVELAPVPQPRFLRDSMDISDLPGARPRTRQQRREVRCQLAVGDIVGATSATSFSTAKRMRGRGAGVHPDSLSVADIVERKHRSTRVVDPLDPVYRINAMTIEGDSGMRPRTAACGTARKPLYALQTSDILGAQADTLFANQKYKRATAAVPGPVPGASADTLVRGIISKRRTNPLNPDYPLLDRGAPWTLSAAELAGARKKSVRTAALSSHRSRTSGRKESARPATSLGTGRGAKPQPQPDAGSAATGRTTLLAGFFGPGKVNQRGDQASQTTLTLAAAETDGHAARAMRSTVANANDGRVESQQQQQHSRARVGSTPRPRFQSQASKSGAAKAKASASAAFDRQAVQSLPDSMGASSCLFPNQNLA